MDYSKIYEASRAADIAYAKWYAQLPDSKKNQIFLDGFNFVMEKIRYDTLQDNPFATQAEITLNFIRATQKGKYPPEVFAFIEEQMAKRIEEEWKARFKAMKKSMGWSYEEIAQFIGAKNDASVKASISRQLPAFAKLAVCIFEAIEKKKS